MVLPAKMHEGEIPADAAVARRLLSEQFPRWTALPLTPIRSHGTDHHIFRLGSDLAVRLPRIAWAADQAAKEARWLPLLAPQLPLAVPLTVAVGEPTEYYPLPWSVAEWLPGEDANSADLDLELAARDLAGFVKALHRVDTAGAPTLRKGARGSPLDDLDEPVRRALGELAGRVDAAGALRAWEESMAAPAWDGPGGVWVHGDLLPGNLVARNGRLSGVIDFGALAVGDPAVDLLPAWNLFEGEPRRRFLDDLGADGAMRLRGRGWALLQAVIALPYYWDSNQGIVAQALRALERVLADGGE